MGRRASTARIFAALAATASLAACASITPEVSAPSPDAAAGVSIPSPATGQEGLGGRWDRSLAGLRADDQRVANVAFRLETANTALCPDVGPRAGLVLQDALQYSARERPAAVAALHVGDLPSVDAIADGSPAARAGLRVGDVVIAIDGAPVPAPAKAADPATRPADYAPLQAAVSALDAALARRPAALEVLRGPERLRLTVDSVPGCDYDVEVLPGPDLNASADGRHVFISSAMVDFARSDDMLALVLGHELGHDLLHHHARLGQSDLAHRVLGDLASSPESLKLTEREADYVGLYLVARAGYEIADAPAFFAALPAESPFSWSHPSDAERARALAMTRDEIEAKRRLDEPLTPNAAPN